jgi:hypothetical protein
MDAVDKGAGSPAGTEIGAVRHGRAFCLCP